MTWDVDEWGRGLYAVRGHVTAQEFAEAVVAYRHDDTVRGVALVAHEWYRFVPDDEGGGYWWARPGSRGAFRVTVGRLSALAALTTTTTAPPASE